MDASLRPERIRFLLQSGAAAPGYRATHPGAKGAATWNAADRQGNRRSRVERATPRLPLSCRVGQRWPKKRADQRGSQHCGYSAQVMLSCSLQPRLSFFIDSSHSEGDT
jgi:hypothetical protein